MPDHQDDGKLKGSGVVDALRESERESRTIPAPLPSPGRIKNQVILETPVMQDLDAHNAPPGHG